MKQLQQMPEGITETSQLIAQLDESLRFGFMSGRQTEALATLRRIFSGTSLEALLAESMPALERGEFQEQHFVALAAARAALQGAQYDALRQQARSALGRALDPDATVIAPAAVPEPLLDSARHWLMELAITGLARVDATAVYPFLTSLAQIRQDPRLARLSFLLTGFVDELLAAIPIARPDDVPLLRWCDLWSTALLSAVGVADPPQSRSVSGKLYPIGVELRERVQLVSVVVYGLLESADGAEFVRLTRSRFKVDAIRGHTIWLLFPDVAPLLEGLSQGVALHVRDIELLPSGDIIWDAAKAELGEKSKLLGVAARYLVPQASEPAIVKPLPPLDRHHVQLAEPVVLVSYTLVDDTLQLADGMAVPLDARWNADSELTRDVLTASAVLFGLLRYDAGRWTIQPISVGTRAGKLTFVGQAGAKLFTKPPKSNPVAILEERAGRLLRK